MKCYFLLAAALYCYSLAKAQHGEAKAHDVEGFHHCYFEERSFSVGGSVPYSFHAASPGVNARLYYNIGEAICFGPEFSYFQTEEASIQDFNFIGHYIFETKWTGIYPLLGVNYTIENEDHHSAKAWGLAIGGGLHRNFHRFTLFAEYAHVQSDLKDDFVSLGCLFNLR